MALSPITEANGCMRFVPGSHRRAIETHRDTFAEGNQLTRGQVLAVDIDESQAVPVTLAPGELSLHHGHLFHASGPNTTDAWRIGITMIYLAPGMRQVVANKDYARLVRGEDEHGHFECLPRPRFDFDPVGIAACETYANSISKPCTREPIVVPSRACTCRAPEVARSISFALSPEAARGPPRAAGCWPG